MENRKLLVRIEEIIEKRIIPIGLILGGVFLRLVPHPPNFAPITGLALFSGARLNKRLAFIIPLSAMVLSDVFLGFHKTMVFVYLSFFLIVIVGMGLNRFKKPYHLFGASLFSSLLFFIITNFGVWLISGMYSQDFPGLVNAYLMGLPFLKNTILGDLFYSLGFFYGYKYLVLLTKRFGLSKKTENLSVKMDS